MFYKRSQNGCHIDIPYRFTDRFRPADCELRAISFGETRATSSCGENNRTMLET